MGQRGAGEKDWLHLKLKNDAGSSRHSRQGRRPGETQMEQGLQSSKGVVRRLAAVGRIGSHGSAQARMSEQDSVRLLRPKSY